MKRALIIHGWESSPEEHWYREEERLLKEKGFEVSLPEMPGGSFVKLEEWLEVIERFGPDEESVLIGHSLGAPAILRYLKAAEQKVGIVILIAGFASSLHLDYPNAEYPDKFLEGGFDWKKLKENAKKFVVINQKDDPWVPKEKGQEIADALGVDLVLVEGNNHFDQMDLDLINKHLGG